MSDDNTPTSDDKTTEGTTPAPVADAAQKSDSLTQADVDRIVKDRLERERAKYADYDELKAAKAKLDEFEESQKTEQQKLADAAAKAREEATATAAELARVKAAVKHGLSEDDLDLLGTHGTPEEIETRAERLAARIKAAVDAQPKPDFGGGDRGTDVATKGDQLSESDVKKLYAEKKYTEIEAAKQAGRLNDYLGIK